MSINHKKFKKRALFGGVFHAKKPKNAPLPRIALVQSGRKMGNTCAYRKHRAQKHPNFRIFEEKHCLKTPQSACFCSKNTLFHVKQCVFSISGLSTKSGYQQKEALNNLNPSCRSPMKWYGAQSVRFKAFLFSFTDAQNVSRETSIWDGFSLFL